MARKAPKIALSEEEREYLEALTTRHTAEQREVLRTKIILLADKAVFLYTDRVSEPFFSQSEDPFSQCSRKPYEVSWRSSIIL